MAGTITHRVQQFFSQPWHFIGFIVFYIIHNWLLNFDLVASSSLIAIFALLLSFGLIFYTLFKRLLRDKGKAALMTTLTEFTLLYFGTLQDSFTNSASIAFMGEMQVLLPGLLMILVVLYFLLKKRVGNIKESVHQYLNAALCLFLVFELMAFGLGFDKARLTDITPDDLTFSVHGCDTCKKPPIFIIVMDEYTGADGQQNYFNTSSQDFENELKRRNFRVVPHSRSNYIFTVFSMASFFNMQYLTDFGEHNAENTFSYQRSLRSIRKNLFVEYLLTQGYTINNFSAFDLPSKAASYRNSFLPKDWVLLLNETLYYRFMMVLPNFLVRKVGNATVQGWLNKRASSDNENLLGIPLPASISDTSKQFYYLHLMMPHAPYLLNENGQYNAFEITDERSPQKDSMYIHYLKYTNKRILDLVDRIQQITNGKGVIVLMSDHGFREMHQPRKYTELSYANFFSVYSPNNDYRGFTDSLTVVNELRVVLNNQFHEQIPLLKDSMVH
ncbi:MULTISPECIES: hypothetical protein [unclassified Paraflavitalea]|uniref:hypothetical protein n=1 Tax=unclassified Paraflavitalea TaxID=2798305 RepID=UPI003D34DE0D